MNEMALNKLFTQLDRIACSLERANALAAESRPPRASERVKKPAWMIAESIADWRGYSLDEVAIGGNDAGLVWVRVAIAHALNARGCTDDQIAKLVGRTRAAVSRMRARVTTEHVEYLQQKDIIE